MQNLMTNVNMRERNWKRHLIELMLLIVFVLNVEGQTPQSTPLATRIEQELRELQKDVKETKEIVKTHAQESRQQRAEDKARRAENDRQRKQQEREAKAARHKVKNIEPIPTAKDAEAKSGETVAVTVLKLRPVLKPKSVPIEEKPTPEIVNERNMLREKVRRQNRTNLCRFLGFGCISLPQM